MNNRLKGLNEEEVIKSRDKHGKNSLTKKERKSFLKKFLESFSDPIIKVLLIALAINTIFLFNHSDWFESIGIAVSIFLATFIATLSEYGNESAFQKLQEEASRMNSRVRRNNKIIQIPTEEIVIRRFGFITVWR